MPLATSPEERWMSLALREAQAALDEGEEPVGAVIIEPVSGHVLGRAHHQTTALNDPTAHAVMIALTQLAASMEETGLVTDAKAGDLELVLVTTQEPCLMCAGALLLHENIGRLVYGAPEARLGACGSQENILSNYGPTRSLLVHGGIMESACLDLLKRHRSANRAREN
ncbi:MAG: nucleoside deaminase [Planctomycetes bacterium]|nr:nucleoside deaminase [Planctomycetota bacterium]